MRPRASFSAAFGMVVTLLALAPASLFAQTRTPWRTADDVRSGTSGTIVGSIISLTGDELRITADEDPAGREVRVDTTRSTRYGGVSAIGDATLSGAAGLRELRIGDRVRVTGSATAARTIRATDVMLIGRSTTVPTGSDSRPKNEMEGVVQDIRTYDRSFVLETDDGTRTTVVATEDTPVMFEGKSYSIRNLEVGDRVRVVVDTTLTSGGVRARRIDVLKDSTPNEVGGIRSTNYVTGRIERIDGNRIILNADRVGQVRVDVSRAVRSDGASFNLSNVQVGDRLRVWGEYTAANAFRAERVEFGTAEDAYRDDEFRDRGQEAFEGYSTVVFYGVVERNQTAEDRLKMRNRDNDRDVEIVVDEEFVVLREAGSFIRSAELRQGDNIVVKAFRDPQGRYIAQTIRLR